MVRRDWWQNKLVSNPANFTRNMLKLEAADKQINQFRVQCAELTSSSCLQVLHVTET